MLVALAFVLAAIALTSCDDSPTAAGEGGSAAAAPSLNTAAAGALAARAGGPYAGVEGSDVAFSSAGSSAAPGAALSYQWTFGDGTTSTAASPRKRYADNGVYAVTLTVSDRAGGTAVATTTAKITNAAPTGRFSGPQAITEGSGYTVSISGTDAGAADRATLQYSLDCGLGAGFTRWSATVTSVACPVQRDQRPFVILRARVRDKDGGQRAYGHQMYIQNAAPVVTLAATSAAALTAGATLGVEGRFTDRGTLDGPWSYTIAWGDRTVSAAGSTSAQGSALAASHAYARPGTYTVVLRVTDKDGKTGRSAPLTVTVAP